MNCNFLALSATIGNAEQLRDWLEVVRGQQLNNVEVINAATSVPTYVRSGEIKTASLNLRRHIWPNLSDEEQEIRDFVSIEEQEIRDFVSSLQEKDLLPAVLYDLNQTTLTELFRRLMTALNCEYQNKIRIAKNHNDQVRVGTGKIQPTPGISPLSTNCLSQMEKFQFAAKLQSENILTADEIDCLVNALEYGVGLLLSTDYMYVDSPVYREKVKELAKTQRIAFLLTDSSKHSKLDGFHCCVFNSLVGMRKHPSRFINVQRHIWTRSTEGNKDFTLKFLDPLAAVTLPFLQSEGFKKYALPMTPRDCASLWISLKDKFAVELKVGSEVETLRNGEIGKWYSGVIIKKQVEDVANVGQVIDEFKNSESDIGSTFQYCSNVRLNTWIDIRVTGFKDGRHLFQPLAGGIIRDADFNDLLNSGRLRKVMMVTNAVIQAATQAQDAVQDGITFDIRYDDDGEVCTVAKEAIRAFIPDIADVEPSFFFARYKGNRITLEQSKKYEDSLKQKLHQLSVKYPAKTQDLLDDFKLETLSSDVNMCELLLDLKSQKLLPALVFDLNLLSVIELFKDVLRSLETQQEIRYPFYVKKQTNENDAIEVANTDAERQLQAKHQQQRSRQANTDDDNGNGRDARQNGADRRFVNTINPNICQMVI